MSTIECKCFTLTVDSNIQHEVERLLKDGWVPIPGVMPVAVYHMQRTAETSVGARVSMDVDDAGVQIMRNGQFVRSN